MILFKLKCSAEHEFDGWFRDNAAYDRQHARGEIACPECGDEAVEKAPMAPRLGRSRSDRGERQAEQRTEAAPAPPASPAAAPRNPAELRRALQELRKQVETNCDNVGPRFAEEARRMHRGEAPSRGIYGDATPAESQKLAEEGIEVACIPWVPPNDA
ncbi:MAG TPA: DUF1178 family protein [Stellaceae bacterium]|nr:DUF1178 family protein [Stellaceae bacterium]